LIGTALSGTLSLGTIESWGYPFKLPSIIIYEGFKEIISLNNITSTSSFFLALIISSVAYFSIAKFE